ncbi:MAG: hypothetical protein ABIH34_02340 [Nanoarchaeota archaeon]
MSINDNRQSVHGIPQKYINSSISLPSDNIKGNYNHVFIWGVRPNDSIPMSGRGYTFTKTMQSQGVYPSRERFIWEADEAVIAATVYYEGIPGMECLRALYWIDDEKDYHRMFLDLFLPPINEAGEVDCNKTTLDMIVRELNLNPMPSTDLPEETMLMRPETRFRPNIYIGGTHRPLHRHGVLFGLMHEADIHSSNYQLSEERGDLVTYERHIRLPYDDITAVITLDTARESVESWRALAPFFLQKPGDEDVFSAISVLAIGRGMIHEVMRDAIIQTKMNPLFLYNETPFNLVKPLVEGMHRRAFKGR